MEQVFFYISLVCFALGGFFVVTAALGILRMPDFYTRVHPAGVGDSLGAPLILLGMILLYGPSLVSLKLFFLMCFVWIAGSTTTHIMTKAAMVANISPVLEERS